MNGIERNLSVAPGPRPWINVTWLWIGCLALTFTVGCLMRRVMVLERRVDALERRALADK